MTRTLPGISGNVWWPGWSVSGNINGIADSLSHTFQKHPALLPAYTAIDGIAPEPVENIRYRRSHNLIRWDAEATEDHLQETHFYVIYRFGEFANDDFDDPANICAVTRDNWYSPSEGGRYAVTVVDHCWNGSSPSDIITIIR